MRLLTLMAASLLLVGLLAGPALAHGRGSDANNFLSTILEAPELDGISYRIINSDEYLEISNATDEEVVVPGYRGEPYLRIGPEGVYRNLNSEATYQNEDRFALTSIPTDIDRDGPPDWEQISDGSTYAWHDHRIHWMADTDPPAVKENPDEVQLVTQWEVPFTLGEDEHVIAGELEWIPGGSPLVWLIPALLVLCIPLAIGLRTTPDTQAFEWPGLSKPMGATLIVLALANVIHLIDDLFATPIPLSEASVSAVQTAFFIGIAAFGGIRAYQSAEGAFTALGVGAGSIFIGQGLLYFSVLGASQTASIFPGWLTRLVVGASVAQLLPMAIAAVVGTRKLLPEFDDGDLAAEAAM